LPTGVIRAVVLTISLPLYVSESSFSYSFSIAARPGKRSVRVHQNRVVGEKRGDGSGIVLLYASSKFLSSFCNCPMLSGSTRVLLLAEGRQGKADRRTY
jgi:hypothetical protein